MGDTITSQRSGVGRAKRSYREMLEKELGNTSSGSAGDVGMKELLGFTGW